MLAPGLALLLPAASSAAAAALCPGVSFAVLLQALRLLQISARPVEQQQQRQRKRQQKHCTCTCTLEASIAATLPRSCSPEHLHHQHQ